MKPLFEYDRKLISILTPREQKIITMYFGLTGKNYTLKEIAKDFEISPQTVAKYRNIALQKLEKHDK
jgi:RNA polymerase sigma factor (sigma-70 family)